MRITWVVTVALIGCSNTDRPAPSVAPSPSAAPTPAPPPAVIADAAVIEVDAGATAEVRTKPPAPVDKETARIRADLEKEAARFADLLASDVGSPADMSLRRPGADLDSQIRDAGKLDHPRGGHGGGGGGLAEIGSIGRGTGPKIGDTAPAGPPARVTMVHQSATDDTSLTEAIAAHKILSAYTAGIQRCYKRALATDPTASGTIDLELTVTDTGRTTGSAATGFDEAVDSCLEGMTATWRFPIPKTPDGTETTARFRFRFKLVPG